MSSEDVDVSTPFYKENKIWPYVHAVTPLALFVATRDLTLSILLVYVFETAEIIVSFSRPYFKENSPDSLIGDPLNGALTIFAGWLASQGTRSNEIFLHRVSFWTRWGCFGVIGVLASLVAIITCPLNKETKDRQRNTIGTAIIAIIYVGVALLFYVPHFDEPLIKRDIGMWLVAATFIAVCAEPQLKITSSFIQVIIADLIVILAAFVVFLVLN
jgi:uncharacterized membrane protein YhaH (DUF805 family)